MANLNKGESGLPPTAFAQAPSRPRPITPANLAPPPRMSTAQAFQWPHPLPGFDTAFRRRTTQAPSTSAELFSLTQLPELYTTQALTRPPLFLKTVYLFLSVPWDPPPWGQMRKRSSSQVGVGITKKLLNSGNSDSVSWPAALMKIQKEVESLT
ncbi:ADP-ribose glycohydrolase OARD1 isoform X2 [Grammomys surdaster]|uniref:ADP-ribose glycohydrolase OARD1 isoform X2 n=1 Tax=Grammomys surdaster TaxID=491861 RepID=UPI00109F2C7C|nr:ADP-ribose glycohydrolase OARD1 isoform X2 [Grammomys surdaster]